ncbi:MAG: hypothetical protein BWX48_00063 [Verrucomicrobia bacterium ADurb.Bin006]|jgi:hypothetical protein|nr:MAG: hypothetical protein BWX48_00063 [Verrucomicrobia bacterium ADurb.Bin006]
MQTRLTPSRQTEASPPPPKLNLGFDVCACSLGHYPWDDWERFALARGLDAETAGLGRLLIREAYNHGWEAWLQELCGWGDDLPAPRLRQAAGAALLAFALRSPEKARWCFARLLDTDGLRGDVHPDTGEWTWGYLRLEVRRVLSTLHNATLNSEPSTLN